MVQRGKGRGAVNVLGDLRAITAGATNMRVARR
jgi:hypothetical protein